MNKENRYKTDSFETRRKGSLTKKSGILLPITSLPSPYGIGDLGPGAYQFIDFLKGAGQRFWQILPLTPTNTYLGNSPYSSCSVFAGNTLLISPDHLLKDGFLLKSDISKPPDTLSDKKVNYKAVTEFKDKLLQKVYENNKNDILKDRRFKGFCEENAQWLDDYSLYKGLKNHFHGEAWFQWPEEIKKRKEGPLKKWREQLKDAISREKFLQYVFFKQWASLKGYCHRHNVKIIGDLPMYANHDSADVWTHPAIFKLDEYFNLKYVSGVPPDYFSETGQRWGNPVYDWKQLAETDFHWWIQRMKHNLINYDRVRVDHFRGFVAYWEIPVQELNAINGRWVNVPYDHFFAALRKKIPKDSIIAEDLGTITPEVTDAMNSQGFPGMRVLLFAFAGNIDDHPYIPENYIEHCVAYTGTHDNNTIHGWFKNDTTEQERENARKYHGEEVDIQKLHWDLIRRVMRSAAGTVIVPMQDILGLDEDARMNRPATTKGNWEWRLSQKFLSSDLTKKLFKMTKTHNRCR